WPPATMIAPPLAPESVTLLLVNVLSLIVSVPLVEIPAPEVLYPSAIVTLFRLTTAPAFITITRTLLPPLIVAPFPLIVISGLPQGSFIIVSLLLIVYVLPVTSVIVSGWLLPFAVIMLASSAAASPTPAVQSGLNETAF